MTDRELLELAAKAAGLSIDKSDTNGGGIGNDGFDLSGNAMLDWHNNVRWNPLTNDGDALRLAVKLGIYVGARTAEVWRYGKEIVHIFDDDGDDEQGTRRAIVRAAAEFQKRLEAAT